MADEPKKPGPPPTLNTPVGGQPAKTPPRASFMSNRANQRLIQLVGYMMLLGIIAMLWRPWEGVKRGDGVKAAGELIDDAAKKLDEEFQKLAAEVDRLIEERKAEEAVRKIQRMEEIDDSQSEQQQTDDLKAKVSRHIEKEFGKEYLEFERELLE